VTDRAALDGLLAELDQRIGLDRLRALHVNDAKAPLGSNRDRHANILEGELGEGLGVFLAHPAVQELPAVMEVPGPDDHGPDAGEMRKLRELHARARVAA
jgi:deoxyribonuclease-4